MGSNNKYSKEGGRPHFGEKLVDKVTKGKKKEIC